MAAKKRLSEAEWEVMDGVWHLDRQVTVRDVVDYLYPNGEKAYTTVQTIMNILFEKGVLNRQKIGPVNVYTPALSREDVAQDETRTLVSRMFEGSFGALAAYLVDSGELSRKELDELRALIEAREKEARNGFVDLFGRGVVAALCGAFCRGIAVHFAGVGGRSLDDAGYAIAVCSLFIGIGEVFVPPFYAIPLPDFFARVAL